MLFTSAETSLVDVHSARAGRKASGAATARTSLSFSRFRHASAPHAPRAARPPFQRIRRLAAPAAREATPHSERHLYMMISPDARLGF